MPNAESLSVLDLRVSKICITLIALRPQTNPYVKPVVVGSAEP